MANKTRNALAVLAALKIVGKKVIAIKPCVIQIPFRYAQLNLAQLGSDTYILGVYALILESGEYAVSSALGLIKITPDKVSSIKIDNEEYYEFSFDAGSTVIDNTTIVQRDTILYNIFNEFIVRGSVPWYLEYDDLGKLFNTARSYADSNIGMNYEVWEFLASIIARTPKDRSIYYRLGTNFKETPQYVPMTSVFYSMHNTVNKLAGNYFTDGLTSALVNPSENIEKIEQLLRA